MPAWIRFGLILAVWARGAAWGLWELHDKDAVKFASAMDEAPIRMVLMAAVWSGWVLTTLWCIFLGPFLDPVVGPYFSSDRRYGGWES
jgi:hypothetical protein